eukprot:2325632-Amphidinium_carterae.1
MARPMTLIATKSSTPTLDPQKFPGHFKTKVESKILYQTQEDADLVVLLEVVVLNRYGCSGHG